jgi:hypothetical protein
MQPAPFKVTISVRPGSSASALVGGETQGSLTQSGASKQLSAVRKRTGAPGFINFISIPEFRDE